MDPTQVLHDGAIDEMNLEELLRAEKSLHAHNGFVDKRVASLKGRLSKSRKRRIELQKESKRLDSALNWELAKAQSKEQEIDLVKREMEAKKEQVAMLSTHATEQREAIQSMQEKLHLVVTEKESLEEKYLHPDLKELLERDAEYFGPISHHILNKTEKDLLPEVKMVLSSARSIHEKLTSVSTFGSLLITLVLYAAIIFLFYGTYRSTSVLRKRLTMDRTLFTVDMVFSGVWFFVFLVFSFTGEDPIQTLDANHGGLSLLFQLMVMLGLFGNVLLRCIMLTVTMRRSCFFELIGTIFLGQHYYQNVWIPSLLEEPVKSSTASYFQYFLVSMSVAIYHVRLDAKYSQVTPDWGRSTWKGSKRFKWPTPSGIWSFVDDIFSPGASHEDDLRISRTCKTPTSSTSFEESGRFKVH